MIFVLGGAGFVGSAFVRLLERRGTPHRVITRQNYDKVRGEACDVLINANGNSRKYMANREPLWDFDASTRSVAESLVAFRANTYVYLSSGDVYPDPSCARTTREDTPIDPSLLTRYGLHKFLAEQLVRGAHRDWLIVRMGGFVGPGLRKNAIFDLLHGDPVWLHPDSALQFIGTDQAARIVLGLVERGIRGSIANLGAQGVVRLGNVHRYVGSTSPFRDDARRIRYELDLERLQLLVGEPLPRSEDEVHAFIDAVTGRSHDNPDQPTSRPTGRSLAE